MYVCTALLLGLLTTTVFAQTPAIYMKVTGTKGSITGTVTTPGFTGLIELTSAQLGIERPVVVVRQAGGTGVITETLAPGRTSPGPITITKRVDIASTRLMQTLAGSNIADVRLDKIEIDYIRFVNNKPILFYKIELTDVLLAKSSGSIVPSCPNGCSDLAESFELAYQRIKVTTYSTNSAGSATADPNPFTYDRSTGGPF